MSEPPAESTSLQGVVRHSARRVCAIAVVLVLIGVVLGVGATVLAYRAAQDRKDDKDRGPDVYTKLHLSRERGGIPFPERPLADAEFDGFRQAQVSHLRGRPVLHAALRDKRLKRLPSAPWGDEEPVAWLEAHLRVDFPEGPEVMRVGLDGDNPEALKALVNAVVDAYLEEYNTDLTTRREERIKKLETIRDNYKRLVDGLRKKRDELNKLVGLNEPKAIAERQSLREGRLSFLRSESIKADAELRKLKLQAKLDADRPPDAPPPEVPDELVEASVSEDKQVVQKLTELDRLEADLAGVRKQINDEKHPRIVNLKSAVAAKQKDLDAAKERLRPVYKQKLLEKARGNIKIHPALMDEQIAYYEEYKKILANLLADLEEEEEEANHIIVFRDGKNDLTQAEKRLELVNGEIDKAKVEKDAPPRVKKAGGGETVVNPKKK
jgi:hypothetical protein